MLLDSKILSGIVAAAKISNQGLNFQIAKKSEDLIWLQLTYEDFSGFTYTT